MLTGDFWNNLLLLWPVILIATGFDRIWRRGGLAGAALLIGLGVVFLLSNFGYLALSAWQVILYLWPLFLIAIGFDILIGRRSRLLSLLGLVLMIVLFVGSMWAIGAGTRSYETTEVRSIRQDVEGAERAQVMIEPGIGALNLTALPEMEALIIGTIPSEKALSVSESFELADENAIYRLHATSGNYAFPGITDIFSWDLALSPLIPINLEVELGLGNIAMGLQSVELSGLKLDLGVGSMTINLPEDVDFDGTIDAAIGQVVLYVPKDVGLRVQKDTALVIVQFPDDYQLEDGVYTSPNYHSADHRIDLRLDMAIGRIFIDHSDK